MYTGPQQFVLRLLLSHEANYASVLETSGLANFVNERVLLPCGHHGGNLGPLVPGQSVVGHTPCSNWSIASLVRGH